MLERVRQGFLKDSQHVEALRRGQVQVLDVPDTPEDGDAVDLENLVMRWRKGASSSVSDGTPGGLIGIGTS